MITAHPGSVVAAVSVDTVALRVLLLVGAAVLAGTAVSSRRLWTLPLLAVPVVLSTAGTAGWFRVSVAAHVAASAVWLGCVLRVVAARRPDRPAVRERVAPLAVTSAVAVAVSGTAQALADRVRLDGLAFDRLVLLKAGLLVLATVVGFVRVHAVELAALVTAAGVGAALVAVPSAPPAGRPLTTSLGTLVPQRPGTNYLHADGQWQRVELPAGRSTLRVAGGSQLVDAGSRRGLEPDGPECASALLADPSLTRCPDTSLDTEDAAALTALRSWLRDRGVTAYAVRGDGSARSRQAAAVLGAAVGPPQALVLTGTWESAAAVLQSLDRRVPPAGVYLAPWLLDPTLLSRYATAAPLVVLPFDPKGTDALRYVAALPAGEAPTASGYRAWGGRTAAAQVFATTPASIFPGDLGHAHVSANGWFPGGTLVAVGR